MKIMQAIGGAGHGGAENFFVHLSQAFHQAGFDQHLVTRANDVRDKILRDSGISFENLGFGGKLDIVTPYKLKKISEQYKPDVYLSWMARAASMTPDGPFPKIARLGGYYNLKYFKKCDHLVGITPDLCDHVVRQGWPADKVHYIPNFIRFTPGTAISRSEFDTPDEAPLMLILGRLHPIKGIDTAIKALSETKDTYLWIAGDGPMGEELKRLATDLNVENRVRFLGWRTDKEDLLATADLLLFPSRQEGFGNVILEAWASKTPIIATMAEGPNEYITHSETGFLSPIDDATALAANINAALDNSKQLSQITDTAHQEYLNQFTTEKAVQNWKNLFTQLVNGAGKL